jgi:HEAT repeat protein
LRFADVARDYFLEKMQEEEMGSEARALHLLAQSKRLREHVMAGATAAGRHRAPLMMRLACVSGVILDDWGRAWELVRTAEERETTGPDWHTRRQALQLMEKVAVRERQWIWRKPDSDAVRALAAMGPAVTDLLLLAVGSPNRHRRRAFLQPLCLLADERAMAVYIEALADNFRDNTKWATQALTRLGQKAVPTLLDAAASDEPRLRRYAIRCLGHLADPHARETVLAALDDSDDAVFRQAALAARHYVTQDHVSLLRRAAQRGSPDTRQEVLCALASLGDAGRKAVEELALADGQPAAAAWLWRQGNARGREVVLTCAQADGCDRETAIIELTRMPLDEDTIAVLREALPHDGWRLWGTQQRIAAALSRAETSVATEALIELSRSPRAADRKTAANALGRCGDPRAATTLVGMLADPHRKLRPTVMAALVQMGEVAREAVEAAKRDGKLSHAQQYAIPVLNALKVKRRLAAGERLDIGLFELMARSHEEVHKEVSEHLRMGGIRSEFEVLLEACASGNVHVAWCAAAILRRIGGGRHKLISDFLRKTGGEEIREALLDELESVAGESGNDANHKPQQTTFENSA